MVDTNVMLLLTIGTLNPTRLAEFKRTKMYTHSDFLLVSELLSRFRRRLTTPNILTEVDNLSRQLPTREHQDLSNVLKHLIDLFVEIYVPSASVISDPAYFKSGLADSVAITLSSDHLVLTDDFPLANRLATMGRDVINLNHLRF